MKVTASLRNLHQEYEAQTASLKEKVDSFFRARKNKTWHYESRLKTLESFALKLETGRFPPSALEDFLACSIVVANKAEITSACGLVSEAFSIQERRPNSQSFTKKGAESFPFDDLRLYVTEKPGVLRDSEERSEQLFEIQVKTFLEHAWSIATHDLIYKAPEVNWAKHRVAFQIKAMLEHAELSIQEADTLARSAVIAKSDKRSKLLNRIIGVLRTFWPQEELPIDCRRLAENLLELLAAFGLGAKELDALLKAEAAQGRGPKTLNLSPYLAIVQSLSLRHPDKFKALMTGVGQSFHVFIPPELLQELPFSAEELTNAVIIP